jgi:hypothetical protein
MDIECLLACAAEYHILVNSAYATACGAYDTANSTYVNRIRVALGTYETCARAATNMTQLELCRDTFVSDCSQAVDGLMTRRASIKTEFDAALDGAKNHLDSCMDGCCIIPTPPQEK